MCVSFYAARLSASVHGTGGNWRLYTCVVLRNAWLSHIHKFCVDMYTAIKTMMVCPVHNLTAGPRSFSVCLFRISKQYHTSDICPSTAMWRERVVVHLQMQRPIWIGGKWHTQLTKSGGVISIVIVRQLCGSGARLRWWGISDMLHILIVLSAQCTSSGSWGDGTTASWHWFPVHE